LDKGDAAKHIESRVLDESRVDFEAWERFHY